MKRKIIFYFLLIIFSFTLTQCFNQQNMQETVKNLETKRFLGKWYEIARFPHSFEKDLVGVTATYSMKENGQIKVLNQGYKGTLNGKLSTAVGKAKIADPNFPGNLRVSFFWIFYSDYLVMELDSINYDWAVIGSSSPNYLWILSRKPQMDNKTYENLIQKISERGYDIQKLIKVQQPIDN